MEFAIEMVDLRRQLMSIRPEIDKAISQVLTQTNFIKGEPVEEFEKNFAEWLNVKNVVSCANGTDALQ